MLEQHSGPHTTYRVNGDLSTSRSIGDLRYKQNARLMPKDQMVCCTPEVQTLRREPGDQFMVLACDGVWDVLSSQDVVDYISPRLGWLLDGTLRPSAVVEGLLTSCLSRDPSRLAALPMPSLPFFSPAA